MASRDISTFVGTSGFSYAEWKGSFYPDKLPNKNMLTFYAGKLSSVEINNTFYRMPRPSVLEGWAAQTPPEFRFSVKASRRITHFKKLRDTNELLTFLVSGLRALGGRLGPVLFQLPPTMRADAGLLASFLAEAKAAIAEEASQKSMSPLRFLPAFEFRHPTWFEPDVVRVLEEGGAALVSGDLDESDKDPPLIRTADFAYLRLRKTSYEEGDLPRWAESLRGLGVREIYAYFKHEVIGPKLARDLEALLHSAP